MVERCGLAGMVPSMYPRGLLCQASISCSCGPIGITSKIMSVMMGTV
jgi:hypothetical protein